MIALELELLDPDTRRGGARVRSLLHADFREVGASGTHWDREQVIRALSAELAGRIEPAALSARRVADGVVLVTYTARDSWRSSLWVRCAEAWRVLFHQGTPIRLSGAR